MYKAFQQRLAVERVHDLKNALLIGAWSNPNFDDGKGSRESFLSDLDAKMEQVIWEIYNPPEETVIDKDDPFFGAMKVPEIDHGAAPKEERRVEFDQA